MAPTWFPVVMLGVFFGFVGAGRMALQRVRYGRWGWAISVGRRLDPGQAVLVAAGLVLAAQAALVAGSPGWTARLALPGAAGASHPLAGGLLAALGLALVLAAQLQMGSSWRIGIEEGASPGLVTRGLFAHSRNPIYAGMLVGLVAFAVTLPTWLSWATVALAALSIRSVVRQEEAYLRRTYGDAFERYARAVPRFVPRLFRAV